MDNLRDKAVSSLLWDFSGTLVQQTVSFVIGIILARLLTPSEFGLVALAIAFSYIFQTFTDVGFSSAIIQKKDTTSLTYSSVFYFNVVMSFVIFITVQLIAKPVGMFYGDLEVTNLLRVLAFMILISSFSNIQYTILRKNLKFKIITTRLIISQILGGVIGIVCAYNGMGAYALVFQLISTLVCNGVLIWSVSDWKPDFKFSLNELKGLFSFSIYMFFATFLEELFQRVNSLFIGKVFSAQTLGFYGNAESLSNRLKLLSSSSLTKVFSQF